EVDDVAIVVTEELNLDVLGFVEETLDKDSSVSESGLGLGSGSVEGLLEVLLLADYAHTTATTTIGRLNDDGESVGISERLDDLESLDRTLGTRNDRNIGRNSEL